MAKRTADRPWAYQLTTSPQNARVRLDEVSERSQYGWGQAMDLGDDFHQPGFLGTKWLRILSTLDDLGWLPSELAGKRVADVGCFSGAMSLAIADRGAQVFAVDEVPEHLDQARVLTELLDAEGAITPIGASLYDLHEHIDPGSLDVVVLSGVLYHLSDMLAGLIAAQQLLRPGGRLLIQTNAVENFEASYANFGRFYAGWWWQPTALCIQDMCEFAGLGRAEVHFYEPGRCVALAEKSEGAMDPQGAVPFKRGVHWSFDDLTDSTQRHLDVSALAPAPDPKGDAVLARRWVIEAIGAVARRLLAGAAAVKARVAGRRR